jgi:prepilin-type processing-associated H-X9-DG protein
MHTIATLETTDRGFNPPGLSQTSGAPGIKNNGDHFSGLTNSLSCTSCPDAKFHSTKAHILFVDGHALTINRLNDLKEKNLYWN